MSADAAREPGEADDLGLRGPLDRFLSTSSTYVLTRFVMLRALGVVYLAAFMSAALQLGPLIGSHGLVPAEHLVKIQTANGALAATRRAPSLFFWIGASDTALSAVSWTGVALSLLLLAGVTNAGVMVALWGLYLSIVHVGGVFYGYGWEIQLLETGLLAVFLCPITSVKPFPRAPPPVLPIWLSRWLIARVMLGAGLIKLRGDDCWRELTCLQFHYQTQPIPGPLSPYFHSLPAPAQTVGALFNHVVELLAPFAAFGPRLARRVAGGLFIAFQLTLILSGNLSFLNWLTIVPALACFDDEDYARVLPRRLVDWARASTLEPRASRAALWVSGGHALVVAILSLNPVSNMLSAHQVMNQSYEPLHIVNTYGAFGSVSRERVEVVVQGSLAEDPADESAYREYELPCKPGPVDRRLCWITPYHRRLDWQMWFLQYSPVEQNPWFVRMVAKLLDGDPEIRKALSRDPFDGARPRWVRAELYHYRFARGSAVWERERIGSYLRPVSADDPELRKYLFYAALDEEDVDPSP
ncbi:MAG: lipase maturation factor family protein [Polyangiaceae bacterium]